jgi:hypothetical protein
VNPFGFVIPIAIYLAGGRTTFWALTKADWPKSTSWSCGGLDHTHRYHGCTRQRDLDKSRDQRIGLAYLWPAVLPLVITAIVIAFTGIGVHAIITKPITTPAERRERRLRLEREVERAEAEHEKAKAVQAAAQMAAAAQLGVRLPGADPEVR